MAMDGRNLGVRVLARALSLARSAPLIVLLSAAGCSGKQPPPYPEFAPAQTPPSMDADNGFWLYAQAADDAESRGDKLKTHVSFVAADKDALYAATDEAIKLLQKAAGMKREFVFQAHKPFEAPPRQFGWRLIDRSLAWRISDACRANQFDAAIDLAILATRFGFDLTGGDAMDASLGLECVDDARRALLAAMEQFTPVQLQKLADGLQSVLHDKPDPVKTFANQRLDMLEAVDYIQDAYRKNDYDPLLKRLGSDVREAVKYLQDEIRPKDETMRPGYFDGFAKEAEAEAKWETQMISEPAVRRTKAPELEANRPWKRWAKNFFETGRPLLKLEDACVARTRLLALIALIEARIKAQKQAPSSLADFPPDLILDPYTGGTFVYKTQGMVFKLYSVGDNFRDDGGQSPDFSHPDLKLESP